MPEVLIAYATNEGQTAKIAEVLAARIGRNGARVRIVELAGECPSLDLSAVDGVIVAASVHAGKHQENAARFVRGHLEQLQAKHSAFLSVSLYAASSEGTARGRADEQMSGFFEATGWLPDAAQTIAGAIRFSKFSRPWQWIMRGAQKLFGKELEREGWPDLTTDREFTDWSALRRFADGFCAGLVKQSEQAPAGKRTSEPTPAGKKASEQAPAGKRTSEPTPAGETTGERAPPSERTSAPRS